MYKKGNKVLKRLYSSKRLKTMGLALLIGCTAAVAQNSAGDYTAGTTALSTVAEEIAKYVPIVVKLCYAIAGVVAVVGAISVYVAMISPLHQHYISMYQTVRNCTNLESKSLEMY